MAKPYEGWVALFHDVDWNGTSFITPQFLYLDAESLSVGKEIKQKPYQVSNSRVRGTGALVSGAVKPEGQIRFQFRSDDVSRVLMSHFQMGTSFETGSADASTFQYGFYPVRNSPSFSANAGYGEGAFGGTSGYVFSVSLLKKYFDTTSYGGTNAIFFKHGICDKLSFDLSAEDDAKLTANYKFRDLDYGTAVGSNPGSAQIGSYSSNKSFESWSATALISGQSVPLTNISFESNNGVEEYSRLGRFSPEEFRFGEYSLRGNLSLDMPKDALKYMGSMFGTMEFSILATMFNGTNDQVVVDIPNCKYQTFDFKSSGVQTEYAASIPFQAFGSNGNYPIQVTVNTDFDFEGLGLLLDAGYGARTLSAYDIMDAGSSVRTLSDYEVIDRDG